MIHLKTNNMHISSDPAMELPGVVFPSEEKTIIVNHSNDIYGGAHLYDAKNCLGFKDGNTIYDDTIQRIQFVHKADDGTITPGLQSEQLVIVLLDRVEKLNKVFPCEENELQIKALNDFLSACKLRVENRIKRGVMGELKK
jgi:hypothetical protein